MREKWRKRYHDFFGREQELSDRLARYVLMVTVSMLAAGMAETIVVARGNHMLLQVGVLALSFVGAMFLIFFYEKVHRAVHILSVVLIYVCFPCMFFLSGGVNGGASIWFCLGITFLFILYSGRKLAVHLSVCCAVDILTYHIGYFHSEWILEISSKRLVYTDSLFSVLATGIGVGCILQFQKKIFQEERNVALQQKEELEELSKTKEHFFACMSHELRTPINSIIGFNELMMRKSEDQEIQEYGQNVELASKLLLSLVNDILDFSQMEIGKMEIVHQEYDTAKMFGEVIDMMTVRMKEKELDFQVEIDPSIPSVLVGDERRIQQILLNVLGNAVKYTEKGFVHFIVYSEPCGPGCVRLNMTIKDSGIGIRKENLPYLFQSFQRIKDAQERRIEGSGLGLAITKRLLDLMGGEIQVDSIYRKGSTFTVILEQETAVAEPVGTVNFLQQEGTRERYQPLFTAPEVRVLAVDDNKMNLTIINKLLEPTKLQSDFAQSGAECLEMTKQKAYHVILMDHHMSDMDGIAVLHSIRKQQNGLCNNVHCLLTTADSEDMAKRICEEHSFNDYILKPFLGNSLEEKVFEHIPDELIEQKRELRKGNLGKAKLWKKWKSKVCITTDCVCDWTESLAEQSSIRVMYSYVETPMGRFADTKEVDLDSLSQFEAEGVQARAVSASVEEYEEFFADVLMDAEQVIHISMSEHVGEACETARKASQGFEHVHVVDSGQIAGGESLLLLYAIKMVKEGYRHQQILENLERKKGSIVSRFVAPHTREDYGERLTKDRKLAMLKYISKQKVRPAFSFSSNKLKMIGLHRGELRLAWKSMIRGALFRNEKIDQTVVVITHAGCSGQELTWIRQEIGKRIAFDEVIVQKASFSFSHYAGVGTIGISFFRE